MLELKTHLWDSPPHATRNLFAGLLDPLPRQFGFHPIPRQLRKQPALYQEGTVNLASLE